jgi:hypothetical protein
LQVTLHLVTRGNRIELPVSVLGMLDEDGRIVPLSGLDADEVQE